MYEAEMECQGGGWLTGVGSTPEAAFLSAASSWQSVCDVAPPGDQWSWTGSGEYWAPVTINGELYGELRDTTGTPLPVGTFNHTIQPGGTGQEPGSNASDPSYSFLAACGLVVLFALGYLGGHQR